MQEFAVLQGGIHSVRRVADPAAQAAHRVDDLPNAGLDASQKRLEGFQAWGSKGVGEKSGQSLDPGHNKLQRRGDRLGHRSKELSLLGRLVDADQEISDPCGYGENAVSQGTGSAAQRRQSVENRQSALPHQVQHREKPLEGAPQLVRRLLGEGQPLRKAAESLRKRVQLVGGCGRKDFAECVLDGGNDADQALSRIPDRLDQVFPSGGAQDLFRKLLHGDRTILKSLVQGFNLLDHLRGVSGRLALLLGHAGHLLPQVMNRLRQGLGGYDPVRQPLLQRVTEALRVGHQLVKGVAALSGHLLDGLNEPALIGDALVQQLLPAGAETAAE